MKTRMLLTVEYKADHEIKTLVNWVEQDDKYLHFSPDKQVTVAGSVNHMFIELDKIKRFRVEPVECDGWKIPEINEAGVK